MTALAVLAYARAFRATDDAARRALRWLVAQQDAEGGVTAAALAEASPHSPFARHAALRALDFTLAAQNPGRGWRYSCRSGCTRGSWEPVDRWSADGGRVYATAINALTRDSAEPPRRDARCIPRQERACGERSRPSSAESNPRTRRARP